MAPPQPLLPVSIACGAIERLSGENPGGFVIRKPAADFGLSSLRKPCGMAAWQECCVSEWACGEQEIPKCEDEDELEF